MVRFYISGAWINNTYNTCITSLFIHFLYSFISLHKIMFNLYYLPGFTIRFSSGKLWLPLWAMNLFIYSSIHMHAEVIFKNTSTKRNMHVKLYYDLISFDNWTLYLWSILTYTGNFKKMNIFIRPTCNIIWNFIRNKKKCTKYYNE